jgi:hypothetical protein
MQICLTQIFWEKRFLVSLLAFYFGIKRFCYEQSCIGRYAYEISVLRVA